MFSGKPNSETHPAWARYGVAAGSVFLGWLAREALTPAVGPTALPFIFFFPAVALAAWYGGFVAGSLASLFSATAAYWFYIEPVHTWEVRTFGDVVALAAFLISCLFIVGAIEAMHRAKARLATTLASIGDGVIATDSNGIVLFLNGEAERLTGRRSSEAAGRPLTEVFPIINEQTRQPVENPVDKVLRLGTVVGLANHTLLLRKDGVEIPIDDSAAPIRVAGGPLLGVVLVFRDFTEHRKAQHTSARLAAIVEFSGDAILAKNLDGAIQTWNAGAERLFGYRAEEIIGRLRRGQPSERMETIRISKDGRPIPVLVTASPLKDSEDNVIGASKIIRDITERKQMEDALRAREAELEAIINRTPFMLTRCSRDLRYTFVSQAYAAMIGRSPGEVAGKPIVEIMGEEGFTTIRPHVDTCACALKTTASASKKARTKRFSRCFSA